MQWHTHLKRCSKEHKISPEYLASCHLRRQNSTLLTCFYLLVWFLIKVHHRHYFGMCLFCSRCMPTMQKIIRVCFVIASWTSLPEAKILSTLQAAQGETFQKLELQGGQQALISETSRFFRLPASTIKKEIRKAFVSSLERLRPYLFPKLVFMAAPFLHLATLSSTAPTKSYQTCCA